jgi:hypothetical protein
MEGSLAPYFQELVASEEQQFDLLKANRFVDFLNKRGIRLYNGELEQLEKWRLIPLVLSCLTLDTLLPVFTKAKTPSFPSPAISADA